MSELTHNSNQKTLDAQNKVSSIYQSPNSRINARVHTWWRDTTTGKVWLVLDWLYQGYDLKHVLVIEYLHHSPITVSLDKIKSKISSKEFVPITINKQESDKK